MDFPLEATVPVEAQHRGGELQGAGSISGLSSRPAQIRPHSLPYADVVRALALSHSRTGIT